MNHFEFELNQVVEDANDCRIHSLQKHYRSHSCHYLSQEGDLDLRSEQFRFVELIDACPFELECTLNQKVFDLFW